MDEHTTYERGEQGERVQPWLTEMLAKLALAYPNGRPLTEVQIRLYARLLDGLSRHQIGLACVRAGQECKWFPSIAELRAFAVGTTDDVALSQWAGLLRAAQDAGAYTDLVCEDGATVAAVKVIFGGWPQFCATELPSTRRAEFLAAYRQARIIHGHGCRQIALRGLVNVGVIGDGRWLELAERWVLAASGEIREDQSLALATATETRQIQNNLEER